MSHSITSSVLSLGSLLSEYKNSKNIAEMLGASGQSETGIGFN